MTNDDGGSGGGTQTFGTVPPGTADVVLKATSVDVDHLDTATNWLSLCKARVDGLIRDLKEIPGKVGDPALNGDPPDAAKPAQPAVAGAQVPRTGPPGTLGAPGPTKFGLFPNAIQLANTHINTYNNMLAALDQLSHSLQKAVDGTAYIAKQYKSAEDANAADIARIMVDPPYVPQEQR